MATANLASTLAMEVSRAKLPRRDGGIVPESSVLVAASGEQAATEVRRRPGQDQKKPSFLGE